MDFITLEKKRYAVRDYQDKAVEQDKLQVILQAARLAPTAANRQSQRLYVVHKQEMKEFEGALNFHGADTAIIVCSDTRVAWKRSYDQMNAGVIDASIITTHMMLQATELGLGSLWVCAFDPEQVRRICKLEEGVIPVNILCLGYATHPADMERFKTTRKPLEDIILKR